MLLTVYLLSPAQTEAPARVLNLANDKYVYAQSLAAARLDMNVYTAREVDFEGGIFFHHAPSKRRKI